MNIRRPLLISSAAAAILAGCATAPAPVAPPAAAAPAAAGDERFAPADAAAAAALECESLRERTLGDGRLEVVALIRNRTAQRVEAQVRCAFRDSQGIPNGDETPWQTLVLDGSAAEAVLFAAPGPAAARYTISARLAR
ncbi:MAG: DUF1425 domain-containing protein [Opitutaceae bacterium]|jgi:hypothetical protein